MEQNKYCTYWWLTIVILENICWFSQVPIIFMTCSIILIFPYKHKINILYVAEMNFEIGIFKKKFLLLKKFLSMWFGLISILTFRYDVTNKIEAKKSSISISLNQTMPQCLATLHCFPSKSLNNNSENCCKIGNWQIDCSLSSLSYQSETTHLTQNTRMGIKNEKTEKTEAFYSWKG